MPNVLVTGGAGFIGSWTVDLLIARGYDVRILDNLQPRVHPNGLPEWITGEVKFLRGDVTNSNDLSQAMEGVDYVIHLAAYQDYMPDFSQFIHTNTEGAALLYELAVKDMKKFPIKKIVLASSQGVYGEGHYICKNCLHASLVIENSDSTHRVFSYVDIDRMITLPPPRSNDQLARGDWEIHCPKCGGIMEPVLIKEDMVNPGTAYGISKYALELVADKLGHRYGIPTVCVRYSIVHGPRNSFYNAYSGIARRFAISIMNDLPPVIYEDGHQLRDYINVRDVAQANLLVLENPDADFNIYNVGGGRAISVLDFSYLMLKSFGSNLTPVLPGEYRFGDTRHTVSDNSRIKSLGWSPKITLEESVKEYVDWIRSKQKTREYLELAERMMRQQNVVRTII